MSTPNEAGEVLWDAVLPKTVSQWFLVPFAFALIALGCLFGWAGLYTAWNGGEIAIVVIGLVGGAVVLGIGGMVIKSAYFETKIFKLRLCRFGVDFETNRGRRFVRYADLESIRYVEADLASQDLNKKLAIGKLALSILAANPSGVGHAIGTMTAQRIAGALVVKAKDMPETGAAVPVAVAERLTQLFQAIAAPK
jgi:hypothetical protein